MMQDPMSPGTRWLQKGAKQAPRFPANIGSH